MDLARLFGKSADKKPASDLTPSEAEASAVALLDEEPAAPVMTETASSSDTVRPADDPKLASLLQRIQQLTSAPEASRTPDVQTLSVATCEVE